MAGKNSTISSIDPVIGSVRVQTAVNGLAIPLLWGRVRVGGNLVWYGDFQAIPHTETTSSGGKGGGGVNQSKTSFTYQAAVLMAVGAGPINGITAAWTGKNYHSGQTLPGRITTLRHRTTVPVGGVVTVPVTGTFSASVAVHDPNNNNPGFTDVNMVGSA